MLSPPTNFVLFLTERFVSAHFRCVKFGTSSAWTCVLMQEGVLSAQSDDLEVLEKKRAQLTGDVSRLKCAADSEWETEQEVAASDVGWPSPATTAAPVIQ